MDIKDLPIKVSPNVGWHLLIMSIIFCGLLAFLAVTSNEEIATAVTGMFFGATVYIAICFIACVPDRFTKGKSDEKDPA